MMEDESIVEFNIRVLDIVNESFALGERISESKLVRTLQHKWSTTAVIFYHE